MMKIKNHFLNKFLNVEENPTKIQKHDIRGGGDDKDKNKIIIDILTKRANDLYRAIKKKADEEAEKAQRIAEEKKKAEAQRIAEEKQKAEAQQKAHEAAANQKQKGIIFQKGVIFVHRTDNNNNNNYTVKNIFDYNDNTIYDIKDNNYSQNNNNTQQPNLKNFLVIIDDFIQNQIKSNKK